jgi:hypothetical protein
MPMPLHNLAFRKKNEIIWDEIIQKYDINGKLFCINNEKKRLNIEINDDPVLLSKILSLITGSSDEKILEEFNLRNIQ